MPREHGYTVTVTWTGDRGTGTSGYRDFDREHDVEAEGRPVVRGSADPAFRGDPTRWNPEQMLLASLSQCHMLWYLHLCADAGVVVTGYVDDARGTMVESPSGGRYTGVTLAPRVTVRDDGMVDRALSLHRDAHAQCFIANSVAFPVEHEPTVVVSEPAS
ncbi:OsmC family protein [Pseudonocardia phyllosphaerae]|uniref:OsmC family protein n=1 Tax=Pseudonocardia phyllosphaerae TaxID=3390502 RepID=UPI00397B1D2A